MKNIFLCLSQKYCQVAAILLLSSTFATTHTAQVKALTSDEFQRYSLPRSESAFDESTGTRSWSFEGHNGIRAAVSYTWGDSGFGCSNGHTQVTFLTEEGEGIQLDSNIDSMIDACVTDVQFQNLDGEPSQELFIQYGNSGSGNFHGLLIVDLQNYLSTGQLSTFTLRDYYEGVILWDDDFDDIYEVRMAPVGQQQSLYRWNGKELVSSSAVAQQTTAFNADYLLGTWSFEGGDCNVISLDFKESGSVDFFENGSLVDSTYYQLAENGYYMADLGDNPYGEGSLYEVTSVEQNEYRFLIHTDHRGGNPEGPYRMTRCAE